MERGRGDGAGRRARAQLPRQPLRVDSRQQEPEAVGEGPREGSGRLAGEPRLEEADEPVEVGEGEVAEGVDVGLGPEEPGGDLDEVMGVAGRRDQPCGDAAPELCEEALVARNADVAEERGAVALGEERREGREEPGPEVGEASSASRIAPIRERGPFAPGRGRASREGAGRRRRRAPRASLRRGPSRRARSRRAEG